MTEALQLPFIVKLAAVFGIGAAPWFEIWAAVPLGVVMGLSPTVAVIAAVTGNVVSVAAMVAVMPRLKNWITKKFLPERERGEETVPRRQKRFYYLWNRYGIPGTTFGAPLLVGTHLATALCIILGASANRVMGWVTFSIVVWGVVLAVLCHLGLEGIKYLPPF